MDAGASEENRMVVLLPGSGGLRTPAEKCRPPGYNRTAVRPLRCASCRAIGDNFRLPPEFLGDPQVTEGQQVKRVLW